MAGPRLAGGLAGPHDSRLGDRLFRHGWRTVTENNHSIRTPMARVRSLGAARAGTRHFWQQRVTSVAGIPLTIAFLILFLTVLGRNHAAVVQILASPLAVIVLILFVGTNTYHMWLGMQVVIEDYV